jgi:hypothetical protein
MKKKLLSLILALTILAAFATAASAEVITGSYGSWTYDTATGTLTINSMGPGCDNIGRELDDMGQRDSVIRWIELPMGCHDLLGFNDLTFYNFSEIIKSNYIDSIGGMSFQHCRFYDMSNTGTLTIPDCITYIGNDSFSYSEFKNMTLSSGMTSINAKFASSCYSLKSVTIPASITEIDESAFDGSYDITDVYYSGTISQWNQIKFIDSDCTKYSASVLRFATIHCSDGDIQPNAWWFDSKSGELTVNCRNDVHFEAAEAGINPEAITTVIFFDPTGEKSVGGFNNLINLEDIRMASDSAGLGVGTIKSNSFNNCGFTDYVLRNDADILEKNIFNSCKNLKNLDMDQDIPAGFADNCPNLTSLELSRYGVTSISADAFHGSPITTVKYWLGDATKEEWNDIDITYNENGTNEYVIKNAVITCDDGNITYIKDGKCSGTAESDVMWLLDSDGVLTLYGKGAASFDAVAAGIDASAVSSVRAKTGITALSGFSGMTNLSNVHLPSTIKTIDANAFSDSEITKLAYRGTAAEWKAANPAAGSPLKYVTVNCSDGDVTAEPEPTPSPAPSTQDLYTISNGKTTFHVPVKTQDAYKVDVHAYYYEYTAETERGSGSVTAIPTEVDGVYRIDVEIPGEIQIGDRIRILTIKQNQQ